MKRMNSGWRGLLLCTVLVLSVIVAADLISPLFEGNVAFAVDTESDTGQPSQETETIVLQEEVPQAIAGLMNGIDAMQLYDRYGKIQYMSRGTGTLLAGADGVRRSALNRIALQKSVMHASRLGMDALEKIAENRMPYDEYYTLLQIVEAEATGGDEESKLLIANVVMNRVADPRFPDSIQEVVWQQQDGFAQFSPTIDGRIFSCTITDSTKSAVDRALAGEDHSQGALFFLARKYSEKENVEWFDENLEKLYEYGGHEFFTFKN